MSEQHLKSCHDWYGADPFRYLPCRRYYGPIVTHSHYPDTEPNQPLPSAIRHQFRQRQLTTVLVIGFTLLKIEPTTFHKRNQRSTGSVILPRPDREPSLHNMHCVHCWIVVCCQNYAITADDIQWNEVITLFQDITLWGRDLAQAVEHSSVKVWILLHGD